MRITLALATCCFLSVSVPCAAQTFTLNGVAQCPGIAQGRNFALVAGTYHVEWLSGAYSWVSDDSQFGGFTWLGQARVYIYATAETLTIGDTVGPLLHATQALAEAAALGIYPIVVSANSVVNFYLPDSGDCGDNRGTITLKFVSPLPTQGSTWGAIKALYR